MKTEQIVPLLIHLNLCFCPGYDHDGKGSYRFAIINTYAEAGLDFHPARADAPRIRYKQAIVLDGISEDKVLNDAFWAMLFQLKIYGSKKHTPDKIYSWLAQYLLAAHPMVSSE